MTIHHSSFMEVQKRDTPTNLVPKELTVFQSIGTGQTDLASNETLGVNIGKQNKITLTRTLNVKITDQLGVTVGGTQEKY